MKNIAARSSTATTSTSTSTQTNSTTTVGAGSSTAGSQKQLDPLPGAVPKPADVVKGDGDSNKEEEGASQNFSRRRKEQSNAWRYSTLR